MPAHIAIPLHIAQIRFMDPPRTMAAALQSREEIATVNNYERDRTRRQR
jgi:hypothetical protein